MYRLYLDNSWYTCITYAHEEFIRKKYTIPVYDSLQVEMLQSQCNFTQIKAVKQIKDDIIHVCKMYFKILYNLLTVQHLP